MHEMIIHLPPIGVDDDHALLESLGRFQSWLAELAGGFIMYKTTFAWRNQEQGGLNSKIIMRYTIVVRDELDLEGIKVAIRAWGVELQQQQVYCVIKGQVLILDCTSSAWVDKVGDTKH